MDFAAVCEQDRAASVTFGWSKEFSVHLESEGPGFAEHRTLRHGVAHETASDPSHPTHV